MIVRMLDNAQQISLNNINYSLLNNNCYLFEIFVSSLVALTYVNIYIIIVKEECSTVDAILHNEVAIMDYPTTFIMKRYKGK